MPPTDFCFQSKFYFQYLQQIFQKPKATILTLSDLCSDLEIAKFDFSVAIQKFSKLLINYCKTEKLFPPNKVSRCRLQTERMPPLYLTSCGAPHPLYRYSAWGSSAGGGVDRPAAVAASIWMHLPLLPEVKRNCFFPFPL